VEQVDVAHVVVVVVEPLMLSAGAGADVAGKPTAAAVGMDGESPSSVDVVVGTVGCWGEKDTPPSTLGSITQWGCHSLPLLAFFLVSADRIIRKGGIAHKLLKGSDNVER
jgi:hypothetical protein